MNDVLNFPRQSLPINRKGKKWREQCMLWGDSRTYYNYSPVRESVRHKRINFDLTRGRLHMEDVAAFINPTNADGMYLPDEVQHFPLMNSKLQVLMGEELRRPFDWRAVVTNMNAVTAIEEAKKEAMLGSLREVVENSQSEEEYEKRLNELNDYYTYNWQDFREMRANEVLRHYQKEYNIPLIFNDGFWDALNVGEEIYYVDVVGGEPVIEKLVPEEVRAYRAGRSNKFEDADVIIIEQYWSIGRIIDTFYDSFTPEDIKYLERLPDTLGTDSMGHIDETQGFFPKYFGDGNHEFFSDFTDGNLSQPMSPYDDYGNIRVMRMFWKSRQKIQKVKSYDPITGEESFTFYGEDYVPNTDLGEESTEIWINEAWEGTVIGGRVLSSDVQSTDSFSFKGIMVNVRPKPVQFRSLTNPSKCHLGVIGSIYNFNGDAPYSMVDMMKPYNYLYDVIHYKLVDALASSWGSLVNIDLAKLPNKWDFEKWMYFAKVNHIAISDSFNEGQSGAAKGKLAGALNNNTQQMISDASGNYIQQLLNLAEYVKLEIGEIVGISKQREGQVSNRETVGGVERATLQSSYITEWYFSRHNDVKRRVLTAFLEAAKIAMKGRSIKFEYITSDMSNKIMQFDGDEFAENDYGIVVDASTDIMNLDQKIESLAQAAMQNQMLDLSAVMKLWTSADSLAEKIRLIENSERKTQERAAQAREQELQAQQEATQAALEQKQLELDSKMQMNSEDNETKVLIAQINAASKEGDGIEEPQRVSPDTRAKLMEQIREFDIQIQQDNKRLAQEKELQSEKLKIDRKRANQTRRTK